METLNTLMPILCSSGVALFLLILSAFAKIKSSTFSSFSSISLTFFFLYPLMNIINSGGKSAPKALLSFDGVGIFFSLIFFFATLFTLIILPDYLEKKNSSHINEVYPLVIFSFVGMVILATANHFLMFFLGLELMSINFYILCGILREQEYAVESSLKYFILGVISSAILLLGIALVYGSTSSLKYKNIAEVLSQDLFNYGEPLLLLGFVLILIGLFFKLSLVPFHFWAPDVYQGAPTPISGFLSVGGKSAAVAATMRIFMEIVQYSVLLSQKWLILFAIIGIITIFVGSFIALTQSQFKRLLAYSSIVQAGFLALGISALAGKEDFLVRGVQALYFYVAAYLFMSIASFTVASAVEKKSTMDESLLVFSGLGTSSPVFASLLSINFLSLMGIPLTAGFLGKFYVFSNIVVQGSKFFYWIAAIGLLGAVISTFYYLKVLVILYFPNKNQQPADPPHISYSVWIVLIVCSILTIFFGIFPQFILKISSLF
ncbi:MAG: NADH-quinone oxidoreductase subunit N [Acidobacteriota bacterium]